MADRLTPLLLAVWAACLALCPCVATAEPVTLSGETTRYEIDLLTLSLRGQADGAAEVEIAGPALTGAAVSSVDIVEDKGVVWWVEEDGQAYSFGAYVEDNDLVVVVLAQDVGTLAFPAPPQEDAFYAYALPVLNEGRYIEADDAEWISFLTSRLGQRHLVEASLPIGTALMDGASVTVLHESPLDAAMILGERDGRLSVGWAQEFTRFNLGRPYVVRFSFGPEDPVAGALRFREWIEDTDDFRTLREKAADNPDIAKLAGAAHLYTHDTGPLKQQDIVDWKRFMARLGARRSVEGSLSARLWSAASQEQRDEMDREIATAAGPDGYVSQYARGAMTIMLNEALARVIAREPVEPLPGGHDPKAQPGWLAAARAALVEEYPGLFADPEGWGGGLSLETVAALQEAGIEHAWIGTANWLEAFWHPEAVAAAKEAGYLVAAYDSYASAHAEDQVDSWNTAQQGDAIFQSAGYTRADGSKVTGFAGKGAYVNPLAVADYARRRMKAVAEAGGLNSLFLDVDATGLSYNDYSPEHPAGRAEIIAELRARIGFIANDLGLVAASEDGKYLFARDLVIGHGMTTPPYAWMDRRIRDRQSDYYRGTYWPPAQPDIYFMPSSVPDPLARAIYAPEHRLPLFKIALHDSIVTSHHWEYGSLKATGQRDRIALTQLLYMVPPLYHVSSATMDRDLPFMSAYMPHFAPLHEELWDERMTGFEFLSADRLVQRTRFANGMAIIVNFADGPRDLPGGKILPVNGFAVENDGRIAVHSLPPME